MKILLIIPNLDFGGAQRSFSNLSLGLAKNHEVFIAVFNTYTGVAYPYGGKLIDLNISGAGTFFGKIWNFYKRFVKIKGIKKQLGIDTSISFLEGADYLNVLTKGSERIIASIRGSKRNDDNINGLLGKIRHKLLIKFIYRYSDHIVAVNNGIVNELKEDYHINEVPISVINNFYDFNSIENLSREPVPKSFSRVLNKPCIAASGRLAPEKGFNYLIDIYSKLIEAVPNLVFLIIGSGPQCEDLKQQCRILDLVFADLNCSIEKIESANIIFLGYQENPHKFISKADLYLLSSSSEGFPNSLAEAMACGVTVLSTDCPSGPREMLAPGTVDKQIETIQKAEFCDYGILMPMLNTKNNEDALNEWKQTIIKLLNSHHLKGHYANQAKMRLRDYSPGKTLDKWEGLLRSSSAKSIKVLL